MTYEEAFKLEQKGTKCRCWTHDGYVFLREVENVYLETDTFLDKDKRKRLLNTYTSDKWEIYDPENDAWEAQYYRMRFEHSDYILELLTRKLLGDDYYNYGNDWYSCEELTAEDLLYVMRRTVRSLRLFIIVTLLLSIAVIILAMIILV